MKCTFALGAGGAFLAGAALALLASYPIEENSIYVCFWALALGMGSCVLSAWAVVLHATHAQRVNVEKVIDLTVEALKKRRRLDVVDDC